MRVDLFSENEAALLKKMAEHCQGAFAEACRDPNITREDYQKLRDQYELAQRRYHEALGY